MGTTTAHTYQLPTTAPIRQATIVTSAKNIPGPTNKLNAIIAQKSKPAPAQIG